VSPILLVMLGARKFAFMTRLAVPRWGCPVPLGKDASMYVCVLNNLTPTR